jgi:hypothetical protein
LKSVSDPAGAHDGTQLGCVEPRYIGDVIRSGARLEVRLQDGVALRIAADLPNGGVWMRRVLDEQGILEDDQRKKRSHAKTPRATVPAVRRTGLESLAALSFPLLARRVDTRGDGSSRAMTAASLGSTSLPRGDGRDVFSQGGIKLLRGSTEVRFE